MPNIILFLFDLVLLPISVLRLVIIYYFGSKYNLDGFRFLDVVTHADKPYFNKDDPNIINTLHDDYRMVLRDDSKIYPLDVLNFVKNNIDINTNESDDYQEIITNDNDMMINSIKSELENCFV